MNWIESQIKDAQLGNTELDLSIDPVSSSVGPKDKLREVPQAILDLKHLTKLDLSGHQITTLPPDLQKLNNLRELSLRFNLTLTIDRSSPLPPGLKHLDLGFVKLADFPFERLWNLTSLDLSGCKLSNLPPGVMTLPNLEKLDVTANPLRRLSKEMRALARLRSIRLGNAGTNLSAADLKAITQISCLEELGLHDVFATTAILNLISEISTLRALELRQCAIDELPPTWRRLENLSDLVLEHPAQQLPAVVSGIADLARLTRLERLSLEFIAVNNLLPHLANLTELTALEIWHVPLNDVTPSLLQLPRLESLTMVDTNIRSWPHDVSWFKGLKLLNLSENPIDSVPEQLYEMTRLEALWLRGNRLSSLPRTFGRVKTLTKLSLGQNMFQQWPTEILGLTSLKILDLSHCGLRTIPPGIRDLRNLVALNLSHCNLTTIPAEIAHLPYLKDLNISGNPVVDPPPEITAGGTVAIQEYFDALQESSSTQLFEAKLIIVGAGDVGKTCLAHKLVDQKFDIEKNQRAISATRGIDIKEWHTETSAAKDFKINIWDFGGQEIYHATHQFFLTKRSLYLFVWDARKEDHIQGMDYWLNIVKLLSDNSPVLVVLNKADIRIKQIDERSLRTKFANIVGFHSVSALTGLGIATLVNDVKAQIAKLPHVGDKWPQRWSQVRSTLEADSRSYIDVEEYMGICAENNLDDSKADTLSFYLHNLGVILHFRDDPVLQKVVILKPEWGTDAVYAVLDTREIQQGNGRFSFSDLDRIWGHTAYPRSRHTELVQLMMRFELCFQLAETHEYIVPELLPESQPKFEWNDLDKLHFEYHYDFMPAGIITRFIARNYLYIQGNCYWRNGVLLDLAEHTPVMVVAEPLNRKIRISVSRREKDALAMVRHDLNHIHNTLNLHPEQMVPCICSACQTASNPFLFKYDQLRGYFKNKKGLIPCEQSWLDVSVEALLTGVFYKPEFEDAAPGMPSNLNAPVVQHHYSNEDQTMAKQKRDVSVQGPRLPGRFSLVALLAVLITLAAISKFVSWWAFPLVIIGGLLGVTVVGAFQLKEDDHLSQQNFLKLMGSAFRQLPLLKQLLSHGERSDSD